jgi:hypothetical protein
MCELLFDLEAELVDQCTPLAFLALDIGGVLRGRAGHRPAAVGNQALFHVIGVDDLAQLFVESLDDRGRRTGRREQSGCNAKTVKPWPLSPPLPLSLCPVVPVVRWTVVSLDRCPLVPVVPLDRWTVGPRSRCDPVASCALMTRQSN